MEHNGRRLSWIAIALSVVALVVSLGGRMHGPGAGFGPPQGWQGPMMSQQAPMQYQQGPQGRHGWQGPQAPQAPQAPQPPNDMRGFGNDMRGQRDFGGPGRMGGFPFFFLPFMLIGGLVKLLFVAGLIWLGFRLIRGRGFGRPGGNGPWNGPKGPGPERGPWNEGGDKPSGGSDQPPYTGDTRQI